MGRYIVRRLLWVVVLLFVVSADHVRDLLRAAVGRPGAAARGPQPVAGADRGDPPPARPRQADLRRSTGIYMQAARPATSTSATATRTTPSVRTQIFDRLPATISWRSAPRSSGCSSASRSASSPPSSAASLARPRRDGRRARRDLGAGLLARPRRALPVRRRHRAVPDLRRAPAPTRRAPTTPAKWFASLILPWLVLAAAFAAIYARLLRGNLIETMSRGLHPHGARQGPARAARRSCATACARRSRRSSRCSASTSASCSAARSSPRPCSTSPASGASPTTRSRTPTCR